MNKSEIKKPNQNFASSLKNDFDLVIMSPLQKQTKSKKFIFLYNFATLLIIHCLWSISLNHFKIMKKILTLIFLFYTITNIKASDTTNVLFIGNSITYYNNMPQMFQSIANNKGHKVHVASHTPGGSGIVNHYVNNSLYSLIASKKWDIVILQPGTSESAGVSFPIKTTASRANILLDSIYKNNKCARVYLYEIPYGIPSNGGYPKYFQIQTIIKDSITKLADLLKLQMLAAGECTRSYYSQHQNLLLHNSIDDIHPNNYGSFLVASSFYVGIYQDSIYDCTYNSTIPADSADKFFAIAENVILSNKSDWRINTNNLHSEFSFTQNANAISFHNSSVNYQTLNWTFGDANSSSTENPLHNYAQNGVYNINLIANDDNCSDTSSAKVSINSVSINNTNSLISKVFIYPNPSSDYIYVNSPQKIMSIKIYSINGKELLNINNPENTQEKISISKLSIGEYLIMINTDKEMIIKQFIKK